MVLAKVISIGFVCGFAVLTALAIWNLTQDSTGSSKLTPLLVCLLVALVGLFAAWQSRKSK